MDTIIRTKNLTKKIGSLTIVDDLNMEVKKARIHGFLGPNGAGKSTTIRLLLGLMKISGGDARIFNRSISEEREVILKQVGALVESPAYYEQMSARENLRMTARLKRADLGQVEEILKIIGLADVADRKVKAFSLGMKQRLGIGLALVGYPKILILDEPTNGLDPAGIHEIRELLRTLVKKYEMTILISSHLLSEIEMIVDDLTIIQKGRMIYQGSLEGLKQRQQFESVSVGVKQQEQACELLESKGYDVQQQEGYLNVSKIGVRPEQLAKELVLFGLDLTYLQKQQVSLEEMFLTLTEEGGSDDRM